MLLSRSVVIVAVLAGGACAPPAGTDQVPLRLVEALFAGAADEGVPEIQVGSLPPGAVSDIDLPADATVLGSAVWPHASMTAFAVPGGVQASRDRFASSLEAQGWRRLDIAAGGRAPPLVLCAPDRAFIVLVVTEDADGSLVRLQFDDGARMSPCATDR